jgi:hypothetical protein
MLVRLALLWCSTDLSSKSYFQSASFCGSEATSSPLKLPHWPPSL